MRMSYFCSCGSSIALTGSYAGIQSALQLFLEGHQGDGHKKCDRNECYAARKKAEKASLAEVKK